MISISKNYLCNKKYVFLFIKTIINVNKTI